MKKILVLAFILFSCMNIYSEPKKIIENMNEFGGLTYELEYSSGDSNFGVIEQSRFYYDNNKTLIKSIHKFTNDIIKKNGIVFQEQEYRGDRIIAYKMYLSDSEKLKRGYDYVIEIMDENNKIVSCIYSFGDKLVKEDTDGFAYKYPFYKLSYLHTLIYKDHKPNQKGDDIAISASYFKGRSLVTFITDIEPMTSKDIEIANYFFSSFSMKNAKVFNSKVTISENGEQYTLYVQDALKQYIKKSGMALITFVVLGFNHKLYPLLTELIEVE